MEEHKTNIAKGSFWGLIGNGLLKLISFVYIIIIARFASQNDVGTFYLGISIAMIISILSEFGISGAINRYIPYYEGKNEHGKIKDLMKWIYISLIPQILCGLIVYFQAQNIGLFYQNQNLPAVLKIFSFLIVLNGILRIITAYLTARSDIKNSQMMNNLQNIAKLAFTIIFFYFFGASIESLAWSHVISYILPIVVFYLNKKWYPREIEGKEKISNKELIHEILPFGIMLTILTSFWIIFTAADRIILGYLIKPDQAAIALAIYTVATSFATTIIIFPTSISSIFVPIISKLLGAEEYEKIKESISTAQRWTLMITLPIGIIIAIFAKEVLTLFYGSEYSFGANTLAIFTIGIIIHSATYITMNTLAAMRRVDLEIKMLGASALLNVILNIILIPYFGIDGAAIASCLSFLFLSMMLTYYGKKMFRISIENEEISLILAAALTGIIMILIRPTTLGIEINIMNSINNYYLAKTISVTYLILLLIISTTLFIGISIILKCFRKEDVVLLTKIMRRAKVPQWISMQIERVFLHGTTD